MGAVADVDATCSTCERKEMSENIDIKKSMDCPLHEP